MHIDFNNLPQDPQTLQRMVHELAGHIQSQDAAMARKESDLQQHLEQIQAKTERIAHLEHQLAKLRGWRFGRSSEKLSKDQLSFWQSELEGNTAEVECALIKERGTDGSSEPAEMVKGQAKRRALPAHLPREEQLHTLSNCNHCGGELTEMGEEVVEQLDYRPASFFVRRHTKKKYCCVTCQTAITAALPAQPIEKGLPGAGLLSHIITAKFCDHQPLYRQSESYERENVPLARSTMAGWLGVSGWLLRPLVEAMRSHVMDIDVLHTDDTVVPVLDPGRGRTKQGRLWIYLRDQRFGQPCALYDYTPTRNKDGPLTWLADFKGYLQADEYPGYEGLYAGGNVIPVSCWSHARRKFTDFEKAAPSPVARQAILYIDELFAIERRLDDVNASFEERFTCRQREVVPRLASLKTWLDAQLLGLSRKSDLARAITYLTKRWTCFTQYVADGRLLMHNNPAENAIRSIALGRKNYLFAGSDQGGERAAVFYSLIETCKLNGINPYEYLADVLARIPSHPSHRIEELLPYNWKPAVSG